MTAQCRPNERNLRFAQGSQFLANERHGLYFSYECWHGGPHEFFPGEAEARGHGEREEVRCFVFACPSRF